MYNFEVKRLLFQTFLPVLVVMVIVGFILTIVYYWPESSLEAKQESCVRSMVYKDESGEGIQQAWEVCKDIYN